MLYALRLARSFMGDAELKEVLKLQRQAQNKMSNYASQCLNGLGLRSKALY